MKEAPLLNLVKNGRGICQVGATSLPRKMCDYLMEHEKVSSPSGIMLRR